MKALRANILSGPLGRIATAALAALASGGFLAFGAGYFVGRVDAVYQNGLRAGALAEAQRQAEEAARIRTEAEARAMAAAAREAARAAAAQAELAAARADFEKALREAEKNDPTFAACMALPWPSHLDDSLLGVRARPEAPAARDDHRPDAGDAAREAAL